jgi:ABC-type uncharacterized transport system permease subunit
MGKSVLYNHNLPDIHDEGKIKRYGVFIVFGAAVVALFIFVFWTTSIGLQNQHSVERPDSATQTSGGAQH